MINEKAKNAQRVSIISVRFLCVLCVFLRAFVFYSFSQHKDTKRRHKVHGEENLIIQA